MKRIVILTLTLGLFFSFSHSVFAQDQYDANNHSEQATDQDEKAEAHNQDTHHATAEAEIHTDVTNSEHEESHSGEHGADMSPLFFIIIALSFGMIRKVNFQSLFLIWILMM
jgi:ABC-type nickel/cobalt efflux system permease component RcnA